MQELATREGVSPAVVVQGQLASRGEVFVGVEGNSIFGPTVLAGIGGVFLEVLKDSSARLAPFGPEDAADMLSELAGAAVLHGVRGGEPWHPDQLVKTLMNVSTLAIAARDWLDSLDINPILVHATGLAAVDASFVVSQS
jgi:acetate---CoA ligase (ADP-forming)